MCAASYCQLWFGDERGYNATPATLLPLVPRLWFGDERGYNATESPQHYVPMELWFGDERGYNATCSASFMWASSCGLVMKEDITQRAPVVASTGAGCGLVMKEDITQQVHHAEPCECVVVW